MTMFSQHQPWREVLGFEASPTAYRYQYEILVNHTKKLLWEQQSVPLDSHPVHLLISPHGASKHLCERMPDPDRKAFFAPFLWRFFG